MISVIVPVYNVEEYLEECLESIRKQTYQNIEVILVNDGSTDGSQAICEHFCQTNNRFRLINQKNQGQSVARNRGVKESLGEYIMFVDSDDVIKANILEVLLSYMKADVDIVECKSTKIKEELQNNRPIQVIFEGKSTEAILNCISYKEVKYCVFTKLYRREIVEKVPFLEGYIYEDLYTGINYLKHIRKIIVVDLAGYYYRVRLNSTMTQAFNEKNLDILMVGNKLIDSFMDDTDLLPHIGYLLFDSGYSHYLKDGINKKSPYVDLYENFIHNAASLAQQSKEVVAKHRLLRLYLLAPKYYMTITYPLYQFFYQRWLLIRKIVMAHRK